MNNAKRGHREGFFRPARAGILFLLATFLLAATIIIHIHYTHKLAQSIGLNEKNLHAAGDKKYFSFVIFADNKNVADKLRLLTKAVNSEDENLFSIAVGDMVQDGEMRKYMLLSDHMKRFKKPLLMVVGNHEIYNHMDADFDFDDGRLNFQTIFGDAYFSFSRGDSYFIILDDANAYSIDDRQFEWLSRRLEDSRKYKYRFVFMHVPLFDPTLEGCMGGRSLKNLTSARKINVLIDRYNVTMLFTSHIHGFYRGMWGKTPYIITGGAGAELYGNDPEHYFYHYIKATIAPSGVTFDIERFAEMEFTTVEQIKHLVIDALGYTYYFFAYEYWNTIAAATLLYVLAFMMARSGRRK
jgi:hypothetical protein